MEEKEATDNVEKVENMIDFQILQLDKINFDLSSRDDVRISMLNQRPQNLNKTALDDIFSISGCDFIFLVDNSGYIVYSEISDLVPSTNASTFNASTLPKVRQRINDGSFLCKETEVSLKVEFEMNKVAALSVKENVEDLQEEIELPEICLPEKGDTKQGIILVVDGDKSSSELLSVIFKDAGYSVTLLYSGIRVLEVAKKLKPDIITRDVLLPDTNGWLVLRQLKNDPYTAFIPVLIISMTNNNELGITLGATYSFAKPVKRIELVNSLREIIGKFRFEYPKVLIVDDNENTVELLSSIIEPESFEAIKAYSGREGLQKLFSGRQPDILILDLIMPEISGFDVISSMRADVRTKYIPLVVCTSGELTEKNLEELNSELKGHLISILKKGTFGRKELINRIKTISYAEEA